MKLYELEGKEHFTMAGWDNKYIWKVAPSVDFQNTNLSHKDREGTECVVTVSEPTGVVKFVPSNIEVEVVI